MASITGAQTYWEPGPAPRPIRGLFDVAEVESFTDPHLALGAEYQTNRCTAGCLWTDMCDPATAKTFMNLNAVVGEPFAVYDGIECSLGMSADEQESRLRGTFDIKAEAVAESVLQGMLQGSAPITAATDLAGLVGELEAMLASDYAGRGSLHMDRYTSVQAFSRNLLQNTESNEARVQTVNGTPVALGRGYRRSTGNAWAAACGRVVLLRGPVQTFRAPQTATEPSRILIEQLNVLLVECVSAWGEVAAP